MKKILLFLLIMTVTAAATQAQQKKSAGKSLRHVVLFKFKDDSSPNDVKKVEDAFRGLPSKIKEVKEDSSGISFTDDYAPRASGNNARKILVTIVILLGLAIIGWVAYYFYNQWQESKSASSVPQDIQPVLTPTGTQTSDSAVNKPAADSMNAATVVPNADSAAASYSVIIETSGKNRALKRHQDLLDMGYKVKLATSDSITFQIYTSINGPLSDTTRVRDSIARFFGRRVIIDRALK